MSSPVKNHLTPRLFVAAPLASNETFEVNPDQAHYLQHVMRMKTGDAVRLFNGRDGEWSGDITSISKRSLEIKPIKQLRKQQSVPDLWLCAAPIKKAHFDYMIEKATELGMASLHPLLTSRTQIREVNIQRCGSIATEASEQSERLNVPVILPPKTLQAFLTDTPHDRLILVCAEWGNALPVHEAFALPQVKSATKTAILTGPEGGFTEDELQILRQRPDVVFIRLGPRILRADTAALAALSCWQALCGDWDVTELGLRG